MGSFVYLVGDSTVPEEKRSEFTEAVQKLLTSVTGMTSQISMVARSRLPCSLSLPDFTSAKPASM